MRINSFRALLTTVLSLIAITLSSSTVEAQSGSIEVTGEPDDQVDTASTPLDADSATPAAKTVWKKLTIGLGGGMRLDKQGGSSYTADFRYWFIGIVGGGSVRKIPDFLPFGPGDTSLYELEKHDWRYLGADLRLFYDILDQLSVFVEAGLYSHENIYLYRYDDVEREAYYQARIEQDSIPYVVGYGGGVLVDIPKPRTSWDYSVALSVELHSIRGIQWGLGITAWL